MDQKLGHAAESGFTRATREYRDSGSRSRPGVIDRPNRSARRKLPKMMMRAFSYLALLGTRDRAGLADAPGQSRGAGWSRRRYRHSRAAHRRSFGKNVREAFRRRE